MFVSWFGYIIVHESSQYRLSIIKEINHPAVASWADARIGNWRNDNRKEIMVFDDQERFMRIFSNEGELADKNQFTKKPWRYEFEKLNDVDNDKQMELAFERLDDDLTVGVDIYNQYFQLLRRFTTEGSYKLNETPDTYWNSTKLHLIDNVNNDPGLELLVTVNCGYEHFPRKLVCFDYDTGLEEWSFFTGPWVGAVSFARNESGEGHILFTGQSVGNEAFGPDCREDNEPLLYLLTSDGELVWTRSLVPPGRPHALECYTKSLLSDVDGDGNLEAITLSNKAFYHESNFAGFGRICRFNLKGDLEGVYYLESSSDRNFVVGDASSLHPGLELAVIDHAGWFHLLDSNLRLIRRQLVAEPVTDEAEYISSVMMGPVDLDGNGIREWTAVINYQRMVNKHRSGNEGDPPNEYDRTNFRVFVFNPEGEIFVNQLFDPDWNSSKRSPVYSQLADLNNNGETRIIYTGKSLKELKLEKGLGAWIRSWPIWHSQ